MALTHVLTPIDIGGARIKNRVVRTAHGTRIGVTTMSDDLVAYHVARGRGGVGLSIIEILAVHPSSPTVLKAWDPEIGRGYEKLVAEADRDGMTLFQQIWHGGHNTPPLDGSPCLSASDIPGPLLGVVPIAMTKAMIDELVGAFAQTARRCEGWGLKGVEVHCAHGYLIQQFLSPSANRREDDYGGPFENRARFMVEVLEAVRGAVSRDFVVGVRLAPDDTAGGFGTAENALALDLLESRGLIDYVNVSMGNYHSFPKMIGGMHEPAGYEIPTSLPVMRHTRLPRIVTGRFRTLEEADQVIRSGEADLVGLTRATIADPDLVSKTITGRSSEVRPCIACNQGCVGQLLTVGRMGCAVNPAVGFERSLSEYVLPRADPPKTVLVIGGGIAGMEAARVARLRGHHVVLAEAQADLGGTLRIAAMAPTRHGIGDIATWLESEVYRLGVDVRLSTFLDADDVAAESADSVIIATGSVPRLDGVQVSNPGEPMRGLDDPRLISSWDLFLNPRPRGKRAVVIDDLGHYEAIGAAEHLVNSGLDVTFVTRHLSFAPLVEPALMTTPALERLSRGKFRVMTRTRAVALERDGVVVAPIHTALDSTNALELLAADTVVFVSANQANREIADAIAGQGKSVQVIGDANSPRFIQNCIKEGRLAGAAV